MDKRIDESFIITEPSIPVSGEHESISLQDVIDSSGDLARTLLEDGAALKSELAELNNLVWALAILTKKLEELTCLIELSTGSDNNKK